MKKAILAGFLITLFPLFISAQTIPAENADISSMAAENDGAESGKSLEKLIQPFLENYGYRILDQKVDPADIPPAYVFDWVYVVNMQNKEGEFETDYHLKLDASYFAFSLPDERYLVLDPERNLATAFWESGENQKALAWKITPFTGKLKKGKFFPFRFKRIGNKTIAGYSCRGYQAESRKNVITFYINNDPFLTFNQSHGNSLAHLPEEMDTEWIRNGKGVVMQIILEGKKKVENNMTLSCVEFQEQPFTLATLNSSSLAKK